MKRLLYRITTIALWVWLLGCGLFYFTHLEAAWGLKQLFLLRGERPAPAEVVVIAMDEDSETALGVGQDLTRWRRYHTRLIQELQRRGAAFIVFDLQFIKPMLDTDPKLALAMRAAGNVLLADCLQKINANGKEFSGRVECSDANKMLPEQEELSPTSAADNNMVLRKIAPTALLANAALDHAPFPVSNDAGNPPVLAVWPFFDMFRTSPSLPVLAWFYYVQNQPNLETDFRPEKPYSEWLTKQRQSCLSGHGKQSGKEHNLTPFEANFYKIICHGDIHFLDYYGPPQSFRMVPYHALYRGKVPELKDKAVFIGMANLKYSPGKADFFETPFTHTESGKMAGVEIMATHFANLLEGRFIEPPLPPILALGLFSLAAALMLSFFAGLPGMVASFIFALVYLALAVWLFAQQALWLPVAVPLIMLAASWPLSLLLSRRDLLKERERIIDFVRKVFPQWLHFVPGSPGLWDPDQISRELEAERDLSGLCLATDIEGYTTVSSQRNAHEMWALLNDYYKVLGRPVSLHNGIIADITADSMMTVWIDQPDSEQRLNACLAALEMKIAVEQFNETSSSGRLPTRIGLHEGEITLGRIDAGSNNYYRAIGDTAITASRIQGANKYLGTRILASAAITDASGSIGYRPLGYFRVEGRPQALELVEITGKISEIDAEQKTFFQQFAVALSLFREGSWRSAETAFTTLLQSADQDGPTRFFLDFIHRHNGVPPENWDGVAFLPGK